MPTTTSMMYRACVLTSSTTIFRQPLAPPCIRARRRVVKVKSASTGPLWALVGALFFAFAGLAWWSFQQISLMEQQLVVTQESFARISEEAAGRLQDISGKVVASQTNVTSDSEALKLQIKQLESKLQDQSNSNKAWLGQTSDLDKRLAQMTAQTSDLDRRLAQVTTQSTEHQTVNTQLQAQVKIDRRRGRAEECSARHGKIRRPAEKPRRRHRGVEETRQSQPVPPSSAWSRTSSCSKASRTIALRRLKARSIPQSSMLSAVRSPQHQHPASADPEPATAIARAAVSPDSFPDWPERFPYTLRIR